MFRRTRAAVAGLMITALPATALDLKSMTPDEHTAFGAAVREYLLENPDVIMEAVAVLEDRQAREQEQADRDLVMQYQDDLFEDGFSFVGGNPDGDITLVEFLDYRCGFCRRAHPEVAQLLEADGNIRLIVKEFPILGDQSMLASRFAIATRQVAGSDAYKAMSDTLMDFTAEITMPALMRMASSYGLDTDAIEAQMNSPQVSAEIQATRDLAQRLQITGTPTFVLQDELLRGFLPFDQMRQIVDDKRS